MPLHPASLPLLPEAENMDTNSIPICRRSKKTTLVRDNRVDRRGRYGTCHCCACNRRYRGDPVGKKSGYGGGSGKCSR